jgi:hypothetical protein
MAALEPPPPYQVVYSGAVEQRLRELSDVAISRGDGPAFAAALKEFRSRLAVYPQFGDPLIDLTKEPGTIYNGIIPPIAMRYGVYDARRLVLAVALPVLMPIAKPESETD